MEEFKRLIGDPSLEYAAESLSQVGETIARVQEKLKILETTLTRVAMAGADDSDVPETSYGYIPLDLSEFFDCMYDLEKALADDPDYGDPDLVHRRVDFIEAGCGTGRNMALLKATDRFEFRKVHGMDLSEPMIRHGRLVFDLGEDIFPGDCLTFDFSPYDVIYFYRPMSDATLQSQFEDLLVGQMKPGAYVIGCGHLGLSEDRRLLSKCTGGRVFKKLR